MALFNLGNAPKNAIESDLFRCQAEDRGEAIRMVITDTIGDGDGGMDVRGVREILDGNPAAPVDLRINSFGGYVFEAVGIANMFREHRGEVRATVEGIAFSAATIVLLGADHVSIYDNASYGIHRSSGVAIGNAKTMLGVAEWLAMIDEQLVEQYANKTGRDRQWVRDMMDGTDDGTIWNGREAVDLGFADNLLDTSAKKANNEAGEFLREWYKRHDAEYAARMNRLKLAKARARWSTRAR